MSTTSELISQTAAALSLARVFFPGMGQAGAAPVRLVRRPAWGGVLVRRLRGLVGQPAVRRERRADLGGRSNPSSRWNGTPRA